MKCRKRCTGCWHFVHVRGSGMIAYCMNHLERAASRRCQRCYNDLISLLVTPLPTLIQPMTCTFWLTHDATHSQVKINICIQKDVSVQCLQTSLNQNSVAHARLIRHQLM